MIVQADIDCHPHPIDCQMAVIQSLVPVIFETLLHVHGLPLVLVLLLVAFDELNIIASVICYCKT